jgi:hypothetical protein
MTDRNSMLIVILGTALWFVIRVDLPGPSKTTKP